MGILMRIGGEIFCDIRGTVEMWRPVVRYEGTYGVSDGLRICRIAGGQGARAGRILKQSLDSHGCPQVNLCLCGKPTKFLVAHLVADAFLPPKSSADQVLRHLNDDPTDNRVENLAWGTYRDNAQDSIHNGTFQRGSAHYLSRLTEDDVREIRRLYATGEFTQRELALRFGVNNATICRIVLRKTWKHIA